MDRSELLKLDEPPSDMFVDHMGVEICARCNGPYWIKSTGSIMPGIGVPCDCDERALAKEDS